MKKQEYIEKYGEEAWESILLQKKLYYQKNKEIILGNAKRHYEENKEEKCRKSMEYHNKNREAILERKKEYWCKNRKRYSEYKKQYYHNNKEDVCKKMIEYRDTLRGRAINISNSYNMKDTLRGFTIDNNVDADWIVENIFSGQKCVYCGDQDWTHLGCDRIDNSKPHTADNVVCSCFICNADRADRYTVEEFKQYRSLHPRACDIPKATAIQLSETGALKKRAVQIG